MKLPKVFKGDYMNTIIMILAVVLIVFIFWFGLRFVFKTEYPILAVASGSMEPVLYKGDLIFVEGIQNPDDIYAASKNADPAGSIIVFPNPTQVSRNDPDPDLIVHRAIEKTVNQGGTYIFKTQGDNNQYPDGWEVIESSVVGKYTGFKIPLLGHIALFFKPFEVKVAFIALWIVALIILEVVPLVRKRFRRGDEESLYK
jgi:signal peptidase